MRKKIDTLLAQQAKKSPEIRDKISLLDGIKEVGATTALAVVIGLPELGELKPKQISALVGVAPFKSLHFTYFIFTCRIFIFQFSLFIRRRIFK